MRYGRDSVVSRLRAALACLLAAIACTAFLLVGCDSTQGGDDDAAAVPESAAEQANQDAARKLADMTLEEKIAQLFVVRPEDLAGEGDLTAASAATKQGLAKNTPGGICYFARNIVSPEQTRTLLADTQAAAQQANGLPLLQCVDEEGGIVSRVANNPDMGVRNVGPAAAIGIHGDESHAAEAAAEIASYLADLGFNVDFAPVCDVADGTFNTIGQRAFGTTAQAVVPLATAQIRAFGEANMLCSAKHFPGIGGVAGDSHETLIRTDETLEQMEESELVPFRAAIAADVPMVMVGHISCPQVTGNETPASLAPAAYELLRGKLGYRGVAITDSLEMDAIVENYADADQGVLALKAGADLLLLPNDYAAAYQGVLDAVGKGTLTEAAIDEHAQRVLAMKLQWAARASEDAGDASESPAA